MIINHPSNNDRNFYYLYYVSCIPEQFLIFSPYLDIAPNVLMSYGSSSIKSIPVSFGLAQTIHTGTYIIDIYRAEIQLMSFKYPVSMHHIMVLV